MERLANSGFTRNSASQPGQDELGQPAKPGETRASLQPAAGARPRALSLDLDRDSAEIRKVPAASRSEIVSPLKNGLAPIATRRNSMIADLRARTPDAARHAPTDKSGRPDSERFKNITEWTAYNRERARNRVQAHHDRGRDAFWPKLTGTPEQQTDQAVKAVDRVLLLATQIEYADDKDPGIGRIVKYRAPGIGQVPTAGVPNTGPGVMYNDAGLVHGMDKERTSEERAKALAKRAAREERKQQREAGNIT